MELLTAYPDVEDIGLALFEPLGDTVLARPTTLSPPLIQVSRVGGRDDGLTDRPRLEVQTFGATRLQARDLAEQCRQHAYASVATLVAGASIDLVETLAGPRWVADDNPAVQRYIATYRLEYRRSR